MTRLSLLVAAVAAVAACASERAQTVVLPPQPQPSVVATSPTPTPTTSQAETVTARGNACVMLYECGCNAGCTQVGVRVDDLKPGMKVGVLSGPLTGSSVFVAQSRTAGGEAVFTVQREDPKAAIHVCANMRTPLVGYGCSVKDSGAARACTTCE